jgi:hypothetical protein
MKQGFLVSESSRPVELHPARSVSSEAQGGLHYALLVRTIGQSQYVTIRGSVYCRERRARIAVT